ncbi:MAG: DNA polymerase I [Clostridiales bacterium]|nr:DNA polymerase I [Clostridiales bacterium]
MKLLAIDSNSILNRAYYGVRPLTTKDGVYTNGIYGFLTIFLKICEEISPDAVVFAFDLKAPTFRHKLYTEYKAGRHGMPEELAMQLPYLKELIALLGYRVVTCEGYEADDILGTLARSCEDTGNECVIATGDRDSLQLVSDRTTVRLATTKMGRPESTFYGMAEIVEKYGVTPRELIQVKALMGDSSDNIPGVPGVGEKTALALIGEFHTVEAVYQNLDSTSIKPGVRKKLTEGQESCRMSLELAEINCRAPIDTDPEHYRPQPRNIPGCSRLMTRLELFSLMKKLEIPEGLAEEDPAQPEPAPAHGLRTVPAAPEQAARLFAARRPFFLGQFREDRLVGFALSDGEELLTVAENSPNFAACAAPLYTARGLYTRESKLLFRHCLLEQKPLPEVAFDCELAAYLLRPTASDYSIDRLTSEYAVTPYLTDGEAAGAEMAKFVPLCTSLEEKITEYGQEMLLTQVEQPLAEVLASMELIGFSLDVQGLEEFGRELDLQLAARAEEIYRLAGEQFNINSPMQLGVILFDRLGLPHGKKTQRGWSTNADVLESLRDKHPIIESILDYRKLAKLKSTYVDGLIKVVGPDGRVHSVFKQTETRTGRISSAEPNLQNIPVRTEIGSVFRKFFYAADGKTLVDADYSQIELRVLAHIARDKNMIEAFLSGADIHTQTAAQVFGMPPEFVTGQMRSRAKAVNFGIVYGIGAYSLSRDIGVTVAEANDYINSYLRTYSGVRQYMEDTKAFAREHGYVGTLFGRRRELPEMSATNRVTKAFGERVAMNTPIQGTAADIIKIAMVRVYRRLKAEGLRSKLVLQVHDELIVETELDEVEQVKALLREEMSGAARLQVPLLVDVGVGRTWYESK